MADTQQSVQEAYNLVRSGRKHSAVDILLPILRDDKDNLNAWWVLANALEDPQEIREALEQVIRLDPDHIQANNRLDKMNQQTQLGEIVFKNKTDFAFDDDDDLIPARTTGAKQVVLNKPKSSGASKIFMVIGIIFVVICGLCFALTAGSTLIFGGAISEAVNDPNVQQALRELSTFGELMTLPANTIDKGTLERGQTVDNTWLASEERHLWTFEVANNDPFTISVDPQTEGLNVQILIYLPDGSLTEYSGATGEMQAGNPRIRSSFSTPGTYSILVTQFFISADGTYTIRLD